MSKAFCDVFKCFSLEFSLKVIMEKGVYLTFHPTLVERIFSGRTFSPKWFSDVLNEAI